MSVYDESNMRLAFLLGQVRLCNSENTLNSQEAGVYSILYRIKSDLSFFDNFLSRGHSHSFDWFL